MIKDGFYIFCGICFFALALFFAYLGFSIPIQRPYSGPAFLGVFCLAFFSLFVATECFLDGINH